MSNSVKALCIVIDQTLNLLNAVDGSLVLEPGNYLAYPQSGSSPTAYDIHAADDNWAQGQRVGAAFISVTPQGQAVLS